MADTPSTTTQQPRYQGAARKLSQQLVDQWFDRLIHAPQRGRKVAYMFIVGPLLDLALAFDMEISLPELNAFKSSIHKASLGFIMKSEEFGYSADVCNYVKNDVGAILSDMAFPMGKIPKADVALGVTYCNTYIKWAEVWEKFWGCPIVLVDVPSRVTVGREEEYWGSEVYHHDHRYVLRQLEEAVRVCEEITGQKFNPDKLAEVEERFNRAQELWRQIVYANTHVPALYDALADGVNLMGIINAYRTTGMPEAITALEEALRELEERKELGLWASPQEKFRIVEDHVPCLPYLRQFIQLFKRWGVVFVYSTYMGMLIETSFRYDTSRPLESLADALLRYNVPESEYSFLARLERIEKLVSEFAGDGVVFHSIKSCRLDSACMPDYRERLIREGIPTLVIESDVADPRYFSEAQIRNRVDAFFEALEQKKFYQREAPTG